ncbi:transferase type-1 subunit beta [Seminavis robusta]|uniref:Transferase type-1 subunit beta n=1 Tax=Seminavis robusta TaxID=568900 RepID=A0A9N8DPN1_9STRA|nr:transferase type-1 subunit beta [Seminavis robusta]|eukprot:Sro281_g107200.1 transferase type-1 subunit beta (368) ;mRNA; r:18413-19762
MSAASFDRERHIKYFSQHLLQLPFPYSSLDTNRLTLVHFAAHALDMLGVWDDDALIAKLGLHKQNIIDWIYNLQVVTGAPEQAGFTGGNFLGVSYGSADQELPNNASVVLAENYHGHIAMTYTALATLAMLGDDFSRVQKEKILRALQSLQRDDGSFKCIPLGSECDTRFLFCACAISHMLNDWSAVNKDSAMEFVRNCRSFDGAIALIPGQEGHGGSTFCGVASLVLMNKLDEVIDDDWRKELTRWCVTRQIGGMQGRPNKVEDTCYSYWIGGTLRLLGQDSFALLDHPPLRKFVFSCQSPLGGFSKAKNAFPDMLHSFYSMSYLNMSGSQFDQDDRIALKELSCTLGVCRTTAEKFGSTTDHAIP